jgi:hypothetical protein
MYQLTFAKLTLLLALVGVPVTAGAVLYSGLVSPENWIYEGGLQINPSNYHDGGLHGAPGPIVGAGLPVVALGYGVYWLIKRRRKIKVEK